MSADLNITLGFELEFICVYKQDEFTRELAAYGFKPQEGTGNEYITAGQAIHILFEMAGIPVTGWEDVDEEEDERLLGEAAPPPYSRWRVDQDANILSAGEASWLPEGYIPESVELASPKYHHNPNSRDVDSWRSDLSRVLSTLRLISHNFSCRFLLNSTTGLHIHLGNDGVPVPFGTCKNLLQLVAAHEQNLDLCHASDRIRGSPPGRPSNECYPLFAPPSFFLSHPQNRSFPDDGKKDEEGAAVQTLFSRLAHVERAATCHWSLAELFSVVQRSSSGRRIGELSGHCSAYNFDNTLIPNVDVFTGEEKGAGTGTVEFRQHAGTLDLKTIVAWAEVVIRLVMFSHEARVPEFLGVLVKATDPEFGLKEFLRAIGCGEKTVGHFVRRLRVVEDVEMEEGEIEEEDDDEDWGSIGEILPDGTNFGIGKVGEDRDGGLGMLLAVNDVEQTSRGEAEAVRAKVDRKFAEMVYGVDPTAAPIRVTEDWITGWLNDGWGSLGATGGGRVVEDAVSELRAEFFAHMHRLHVRSDNSS